MQEEGNLPPFPGGLWSQKPLAHRSWGSVDPDHLTRKCSVPHIRLRQGVLISLRSGGGSWTVRVASSWKIKSFRSSPHLRVQVNHSASQAAPGCPAPGRRPSLITRHCKGPAPPHMRGHLGRQDSILQTRAKWSKSRSVVSDALRPQGLYSLWNSPGQNTGVGSRALLQGIFQIQGSNPGLPHCRWILYQLSHQGSPNKG